MYRHTQVGYVTGGTAVVAALCTAALGRAQGEPALGVLAAVLAASAWLFSSLTVEVGGGEIRSHFGPGFWKKRIAIADVADAALAASHWWEGWGIRVTPRGMLYNVSGTTAVELRLRSGARVRLGTDQPDALLAAVRGELARRGA